MKPRIPGELLAGLLVALALLLASGDARAQTILSGHLAGEVVTAAGDPVNDVRVVARDARSGIAHVARTDADGRFTFRLLPAGEYDVLAEKLDFRPAMLTGLDLRPGRSLDVTIRIAAQEPPVTTIDTTRSERRGNGLTRAGAARWLGDLEMAAPRDAMSVESLLPLASNADDHSVEGLPASMMRFAIAGFSMPLIQHPYRSRESTRIPLSVSGLDGAELATNLLDVEFDGSAGAQLLTYPVRGTRDFEFRAWGTGADADFPLGRFATPVAADFDLYRAGATFSGPLIADTAVFALGADLRRRTLVSPQSFRIDDPVGAAIAARAREAGDPNLEPLTLPLVSTVDELIGYGRFDWRVADGQMVSAFADIAVYRAEDLQSPLQLRPAAGSAPDGTQIIGGASLRSVLGPRFANEVRVGISSSALEYANGPLEDGRGSALPTTLVVDRSLALGANPAGAASIDRFSFGLEQALIISLGRHALKVGFDAEWESFDDVYELNRGGLFVFGGPAEFESGVGRFEQRVGSSGSASYSILETGAFIQDTWRPARGLELVAGVRVVDERLPSEGVQINSEWLRLSGLRNDERPDGMLQISPRLGFRWDLRDRGGWVVRGLFGIYHDDAAPELVSEWLTHDGGVRARRALGSLDDWAAIPDSVVAPLTGPVLTLLGPEFHPPQSTRASFGVSRVAGTSIHLSGSYRHTDFLPARRDLNRLRAPSAHDQYGRPLYGEIVQQGSLLAVEPGTNRRFSSFDVVSAIEASSFSDYWDATVMIERRVARSIRLAASYTFSRTRDNWLAHPGAGLFEGFAPEMTDSAARTEWAEGVSDFDVPHRLSVVAEVTAPLPLSPTVGVVYRLRSGQPFTPGFAPGVDANGDYAANDPAFIDPSLPGMEALVSEWDCLSEHAGAFAERNACRGDMLDFLDLRLSFDVRTPHGGGRVFAEALNLLGTELTTPDRALVLVDSSRQLERDEQSGTVTVPLLANPNFGRPVQSTESGRVFRLGVEIGL